MNPPANLEAEMQKRIREHRAVFVAGTGVSIAASIDPATGKPHPQAAWAGLLQNGLERGLKMGQITPNLAGLYQKLLQEDPATHNFISVAAAITSALGGAQSTIFAAWLADTVGMIKAHDHSVLDALDALRKHGNLLATTNYDSLLLGAAGQLTPVTWNEKADFLSAARAEAPDSVIFLHGHWQAPKSVILDWKSYEEISRDEEYRADLAAFWKMTTWVYVGCGLNGLSDPDFGLLLERHGERARNANHWDFCLVRKKDQKDFQKHFTDNNLNICAISFGDDHKDLPQYLRSLLPAPVSPAPAGSHTPISTPPAFYAVPDYIGSHKFVGRASQLQDLTDWAKAADPTNLLLFECIGGNGKSMLTWEWTTKHATSVRSDWAGRFWYSFYQRGAVMADFCRRALAYMTGRPLEELDRMKTPKLAEDLLAQLHAHPWLLILDGLERVLVAYHRIDVAEVPDEEANVPTDKVLNRNPCDTILEEDGDLLRALAAAKPSKILVSSRLTPRVLLNQSGQPIPSAKRITLPGLRPADAEKLLRSCGISGDSARIQDYLTQNCDNHPLVIAVLAGLIANYLPNRGNFDGWLADTGPHGGAKLNLASLDLIQRWNHILRTALDALPEKSRQFLSTLALLSESVNYETLAAFNPHMPPEPEEVDVPEPSEKDRFWERMSDEQKAKAKKRYEASLARRKDYEQALKAWRESAEVREAPGKLAETVKDLEHRGLLQCSYDPIRADDEPNRLEQRGLLQCRYDLHPVVRGVVAGGMEAEDRERYGQRVVDHFSSMPHSPYEQARTLEDLNPGLHVVRTLLKIGRREQAAAACSNDLFLALLINLEAYSEALSLLRPFFSAGWDTLPEGLSRFKTGWMADCAGTALLNTGSCHEALAVHSAVLLKDPQGSNWEEVRIGLGNLSDVCADLNRPSKQERLDILALDLATICGHHIGIFMSRLRRFRQLGLVGSRDAEHMWSLLDPMGRVWPRANYRPGAAELALAQFRFWQGQLTDDDLVRAERAATRGNNHAEIRRVHELRGAWRLDQREWALAAASFHEAVRMARERRLADAESEAGLAMAKLHLGQLGEPDEARQEAERLAGQRKLHHRYLAMLWRAIGDYAQTEKHTLAAYKWAWADGEPYVRRYELTKTTELLNEMNVPIPFLPPYDPAKDEPFPWEAAVRAAIEKLRAEKGAENRKTD